MLCWFKLDGLWVTHAVDTSWSCAHTLMLADLDGDGRQDLVAGKRFQGHDFPASMRKQSYAWLQQQLSR